jgi:hypothetical protein
MVVLIIVSTSLPIVCVFALLLIVSSIVERLRYRVGGRFLIK